MGKDINFKKFREPYNITPLNFSTIEQNIYALVLCELSKKSWANEKSRPHYSHLDHIFEFEVKLLKQRIHSG